MSWCVSLSVSCSHLWSKHCRSLSSNKCIDVFTFLLFIISALIATLFSCRQSSSLSFLVHCCISCQQTHCAQEIQNLDQIKESQEMLKFPTDLQSCSPCSNMVTRWCQQKHRGLRSVYTRDVSAEIFFYNDQLKFHLNQTSAVRPNTSLMLYMCSCDLKGTFYTPMCSWGCVLGKKKINLMGSGTNNSKAPALAGDNEQWQWRSVFAANASLAGVIWHHLQISISGNKKVEVSGYF